MTVTESRSNIPNTSPHSICGLTSLSRRMGTHSVFINCFLPLVSQENENGRKYGDYSVVCETSKIGLTHYDRVNARKVQMECNQTATFEEIREYERVTGKAFPCDQITHLLVEDLVEDSSLIALLQRSPNVISIDLVNIGISDASLQAIILGKPNLEHLNLRMCKAITADGLRSISKKLKSLRVENNPNISDAGLRDVLENCPELQHLSVSGCKNITDLGLGYIAIRCPNLQSLDASYCWICSEGLQLLAERCHELQHLDVSGFYVRDAGLEFIAAGCKRLKSLGLDFCNITDTGLGHLCKGCPNLESIDVYECKFVSFEGVQNLLHHCLKLERIFYGQGLKPRAFFLPVIKPKKKPSILPFIMQQPAAHLAISALFAKYLGLGFWPGVLLFASMQGVSYAMRNWVRLT